jgi:hypothetical protein
MTPDFTDDGDARSQNLELTPGTIFIFRRNVPSHHCEEDWQAIHPNVIEWCELNNITCAIQGQSIVVCKDQPHFDRAVMLFKIRWC